MKKDKNMTDEFKNEQEECLKLVLKKNDDYTSSEDFFRNFLNIEFMSNGRISTEDGLLTRMCDKFSRAITVVDAEATVDDETIDDTLRDLANYSLILLLYKKYGKKNGKA